MSNAILSASATGTGSVTLLAPVTNSTQTLTLPDTTATLITDSAGILNIGSGQLYKDASGNVGIGTSSPTQGKLVVNTGVAGNLAYFTDNINTDFYIKTGSLTATIGPNAGSTNLAFQTGGTERMRLDSSGNLLVGATSRFSGFTANNRLYVESSTGDYFCHFRSTNAAPYGLALTYSTAPNGASNNFIDARDSSAQRFAVNSNGGVSNFSGNNTNLSDRREKTNFAPAKPYLDVICAIPVQTFNYANQNLEDDPGTTLGVVAQDVQTVAPELVSESNWAGKDEEPKMRLSLYQTDLQYALMKCIQEQQALITTLTQRISALETK